MTRHSTRTGARIAGACLSICSILSAPALASEIWVAPTYQADVGGLGVGSNVVWPVTPAGAVRLAWAIPGDLQTFQAAKLVLIPQAAGASTLTVFVCPAKQNELVTAACVGPFNHPFTGVANELTEIDVSATVAPLVGAPGATYLSVLAFTAPTTLTDRIVGLRFGYASSIPAGGASLGSNIFTATQTIDGANLDLDPATPTTGLITKNGVPFLHDFGVNNLFLGLDAGNTSMAGASNTGIGANALESNSTGERNTGIGNFALQFNLTGSGNTAVGHLALQGPSFGSNNVSVGASAGFGSSGSNNIFLGAEVGGGVGESNAMYLGKQGIQTKTVIAGIRGTGVTGGEMVLIDASGRLGSGAFVPGTNTIGTSQVIDDSLTASDLAANSVGTSEVAFNYAGSPSKGGAAADLACVGCVAASEVSFTFATPDANTFTGTQTINSGNLDLDASTAMTGVLTKNGTRFLHNPGTGNTFLGESSGNLAVGGSDNTGVGLNALLNLANAVFNTGVGASALELFNGVAGGNTAVGRRALGSLTNGGSNTAIGSGAGDVLTSGNNNIYLDSPGGAANESATIRIGDGQTRAFMSGIRDRTTGQANAIQVVIDSNGQLGTVSSSRRYKEDIHDMGDASRRLLALRPVTFRYTQAFDGGVKPMQFGLIAEEVAEVFPDLAVRNADGQVETVQYQALSVLLLNELQRLQRRVEALERKR